MPHSSQWVLELVAPAPVPVVLTVKRRLNQAAAAVLGPARTPTGIAGLAADLAEAIHAEIPE